MSNAAVINATSTSGQTVGAPISIETGGDVVLKAYGTGEGNWFVVMAFAPVVNGVTGAPVTLTIDYNQPGRQTSAVGTSATEWVGWVLDQGGTWQASGIVEGYQPGEALSDDLGTFASVNALPKYGVKIGARASVNGVQYTYGAGGWVETSAGGGGFFKLPDSVVDPAINPTTLSFKRIGAKALQFATRKMISGFDLSKNLTLQYGNNLFGVVVSGSKPVMSQGNGALTFTGNGAAGETVYMFGGHKTVNVVDIDVTSISIGQISVQAYKSATERISIYVNPSDYTGSNPGKIGYTVTKTTAVASAFSATAPSGAFTLRVQFTANDFSVFVVKDGVSTTIYTGISTASWWNFRNQSLIQDWKVGFGISSATAAVVVASITRIEQFIDCGVAQADPRVAIYEDGTNVVLPDGTYYLTMTCRGSSIANAYQGLFKYNPATFSVEFIGILYFDRGDGIWRNDNAGFLMYDRLISKWRVIVIGHSDYPGTRYNYSGTLELDPGMSCEHVVKVSQTVITGTYTFYEDFHCVYDPISLQWVGFASGDATATVRMVSPSFDGPWAQTHDGGANSETGETIVNFGGNRYVIAGYSTSASTLWIVRNFDDNSVLGYLTYDQNTGGSRIWPCIVQRYNGTKYEYYLLTFDRSLPNGAYSYGGLYLYKA